MGQAGGRQGLQGGQQTCRTRSHEVLHEAGTAPGHMGGEWLTLAKGMCDPGEWELGTADAECGPASFICALFLGSKGVTGETRGERGISSIFTRTRVRWRGGAGWPGAEGAPPPLPPCANSSEDRRTHPPTFLSSSGLTVLLPSLGRVLRPHPSTCWSHLDRGHCGFQPRPPTKPEQAPLSLPRKTPSPLSPWSHGLCHHPQQRAGCRITPRNLRPSGEKTFLFLFCHLGTDKLP